MTDEYSTKDPTYGAGLGSTVTITRPANTTAYAANDVVGGALDLGIIAPSGGGDILFTSALLMPRIAAVPSGMTYFTLYLYSVTPPSAIADNGAWTLATADLGDFLGSINLSSPALPATSSNALYSQVNTVNVQVTAASQHVYAYLVTAGGFTPAANSEVYDLTVKALAV